VVYIGKLRPVLAGGTSFTQLSGQRSDVGLTLGDNLCREGADGQASLPSVIADVRVVNITGAIRISIVDGILIYARHVRVVPEVVVVPVAAFVTCAVVSVAVVHAAIESDVRSPVSVVPQVTVVIVAPVTGGPERAAVWG
jgi:hypothetical protein